MAAKSLPTINLQGLDPDEIKSLNRELAKLANIEPKLRLSTKALGGAYGRYTSALRKGAETTVLLAKLSQDQSIQKMSVKMEESLLSTLSFMERSAYKTKQAVTIAAQNTTASEKARSAALMDSAKERVIIETRVEKEIRKIEESILETRRNTSNMSKEEVKKEVESKKELISVQEKYLDYEKTRIKTEEKSIAESATVSDRLMSNFRDLLQKFADAQTDDQRELIQQRIEGQMLAEKDTLEILTDKYESEKEIIKAGEAELGNLTGDEKSKKETEIKVRKHAILTLNKEISTLKTDTVFRQKQVEATSGQYKKGKRGFAGEVVSKSFTGGLFGALKGEGFGDIFTNMFKIGLERTGILGKKLPKMLGGGNVGAVLYGSQSEEARKASTQTTERIKASGAGISKISTYNEQLDTNLQKAGVAPAVKKTQPTLASTTAVSPDVFSKSITDAVSQSVFTAQEQIPEGTDSLDVNTAIRNAVFSAIVDTTKSTQSTTGALTTEDIMSVMSAVESALRTTEETATSEEVLTTTINALTTKLQSIETAKTALPLEPNAVAPLQTTAEAVEPEQVTTSGKKKSVKTTGVGGIVTDFTTIQSLVLFTDEMKSFAESIKTINQSITTGLDSLTKQITTIASSDLVSTYESTIKSVTSTLTNLELATKQLTECETTLKSTTDAVYAVFDILKTKTTDVSASEEYMKTVTEAVSKALQELQTNISASTETDSKVMAEAVAKSVSESLSNKLTNTEGTSTSDTVIKSVVESVTSALENLNKQTTDVTSSEQVLKTVTDSVSTALQSLQTQVSDKASSEQVLKTVTDSVSLALTELQAKTSDISSSETKTTAGTASVSETTIKTITDSVALALQKLESETIRVATSEETLKAITDTVANSLQNIQTSTGTISASQSTIQTVTDSISSAFRILQTDTTNVSSSQNLLNTVTESVSKAFESMQMETQLLTLQQSYGVNSERLRSEILNTVTESVSKAYEAFQSLQTKVVDVVQSEESHIQIIKSVSDALQTQLQNLQTNASTSSTIEEKIKTVGETLQLLQLKTAEVTTAEEFLRTTTESVTRSFNDLKSNSVTTSFTEATTSFVDSIKSINEAIQSLTTNTLELFGAETTLSSSTIDITKSQQSETLALDTSSVVVNLDIDTQKKSTEQTSKTTEEISRLTSAFDVLTQRIEQLAIDQSKISQEISTASNNIVTESLKTNTATSTTAATATRSTAESVSSEALQTSTDAASSALNRVTTTAISLDSAKKDLSETVVRTDDSMTNLGTNINTVVDSIDVSLLQRESTTGEVNTSKDISDELARLKTEETSESNSKKTKTVSTKQKAEDEALVMSEESTRSLIELTAVGKSSSDDLKTIAKVTSEQNARQESSTVSVSDENLRTLADRNISIGEDLVRTSIETMETLRQSVSRQPEGSPGSLLPSGESRMPKMDEFVPLAQEAYTSMIELSKSALEQGSIYTHDIHSEQILSSILSIMRSDSEALSSTQESSEKTAEKTTESSEDLKTQSQKSNEMSKESGKETWKSLYSKTKDKLKEDVRNVVNKSIDTVENVKEKIKSAAGGIKDTTIGLAKKAYSSASGVAQTVGGAIGRKYTAVRESIGRGMIAAKEGTVKGLTTAKESLGRGYTIAKEAVGGRLRATKEKISKFGSTAYAGIKNIFSGRSRESTSRSTSTSFLKIAKEKMSSTFKSVGEFFTKPRGSVGGILNNTKMGIKSAFGRVTKFFGKGEKGVSSGSIISRAKSTLKNTYNRVTDFTKGKFGSLATAAKGGIKGLLGFGKEEANGKSEETALYTKDIQADKWLEDIYNFLKDGNGKKVDEGSSESKDGQGGKEGAAPGGMGKKKGGIGGFLSSLAEGIKSFGDMKVIRGALGLAAVGVSMIPFAIGMGILGQIPFSGILSGLVAIAGLAAILIVVSKFEGDILMGALALAAVGLAMMPLAYSMQMMSGIDLSTVGVALAAVTGLALVAGVIGAIALTGVGAAAIAAGAALIAVIGLAMMPLAIGLQMMSAADPGKLSALAGSLMALVPPIALFSLISPMMALAGLGMIGFGAGLALMSLADPKVLSELAKSLMDLVLPLGIFGFLAELMVLAGIGLGAIGLGMIPLALVTNMINEKGMDAIVGFVNALAAAGPMLIIAALGILATGAALLVLTSAIAASNTLLAAGNILGDIASYLGFDPGPGILGVITTLASQSAQLLQTATALLTIADAVEKVGAAFGALSANPEIALETISTLVSMDATKIQNLQDVSLAMERVTTANQQLRGENQAMRTGAAIGEAGGMGGNASIVNATTVGNTNMIVSPPGGRNSDPSILFSGERYYSMLYR